MEKLWLPDHAREALARKRLSDLGPHAYARFEGKERAHLNTEEEIRAYIDGWSQSRREAVEGFYFDTRDKPLPSNFSTYVIVPVAATQETGTLAKTLSHYARQDADPSTWSLLLFLNYTEAMTNYELDHYAAQQTFITAQEFAQAHPDLAVRIANTTYFDTPPPIGAIRGDAWDCALYDIYKNGVMDDGLIGISHDADSEWISPNYISTMQKAAREHPNADLLTCRLSWHQDGNYTSDANKILRYWEYLCSARRHRLGKLITSDANTALRLSSYAAISGFKRNLRLAEMIDICERLHIARDYPYGSTEGICFVDTIRLKTNSRRIYQAIANGYSPGEAWTYLPFLTGKDPVRGLDTAALADRPVDERVLKDILDRMEFQGLDGVADRRRLQKVGRRIISLPAVA